VDILAAIAELQASHTELRNKMDKQDVIIAELRDNEVKQDGIIAELRDNEVRQDGIIANVRKDLDNEKVARNEDLDALRQVSHSTFPPTTNLTIFSDHTFSSAFTPPCSPRPCTQEDPRTPQP
jgi:peptidoglycan hydrolase CwlO-like protein